MPRIKTRHVELGDAARRAGRMRHVGEAQLKNAKIRPYKDNLDAFLDKIRSIQCELMPGTA